MRSQADSVGNVSASHKLIPLRVVWGRKSRKGVEKSGTE